MLASLLEQVVSVAGQMAVDSELPAELPFCQAPPVKRKAPFQSVPVKFLDQSYFLKKYPQFYYREMPDYRCYLP